VPGSLPERSEGTGTHRSAPHSLPSKAREGTTSSAAWRLERLVNKGAKNMELMEFLNSRQYSRHIYGRLRNKVMLALQNYVVEHYHDFITTYEAELILVATETRIAPDLLDDELNVLTCEFKELIDFFMERMEVERRYYERLQQYNGKGCGQK
jgi:hypothetical protein